jgi:flagellar hook-associated protein 3 FlgL
MMNRTLLTDLQSTYQSLSTSEQELSSGEMIQEPSDNPFGASQVLALKANLAANTQYQTNVNDASSWQSVTDTALSDIGDAIQRARDLVLQGATSTTDASGRAAIATEITQLIDSIKTDANTRDGNVFVFSGTATTTQPYQMGANDAYAGNTSAINREIGPGVQVPVNQVGQTVIGDDTTGLLASLRTIVADLNSGNTAALSTTDIASLDTANDTVLNARAQVGALSNRLSTALNRLQSTNLSSTQMLSNTDDTDMAQVMVNFSTQQAAYEAALRAGAQIIQPSLMDFLSTG